MNVAELWRYPVKSAGGERLTTAVLGAHGIAGDRALAVRDEDGEITWAGETPPLMRLQAATLPDGSVWLATPAGGVAFSGPDRHRLLAEAAGRPVSLVDYQPHRIEAAVHLLSTASLRSLASALPEVSIEVTRFRPNILVDVPGDGFPEQRWIGSRVQVGAAVLRVTEGCVRCVMINQATLRSGLDKRVLRWVAQNQRNVFGVYAAVETPGAVALGDAVSLLG